MRDFIKKTVLLLIISNLFSFIAFAELETDNNIDIGNSTGVIVPLPSDDKGSKEQENSKNNSSNSGGNSYRTDIKSADKEETEQEPTQSNIKAFSDIKRNDWFYDDVMFVFNNSIMKGTGENEFSPDDTLNRAMMITILHRINGDNSVCEKDIFNDVEKNSWYENAVNWGFENKIVAGTGKNTFEPMNNLTREQLCVMLYNYTIHIGVKTKLSNISSYSDNKEVSDWAREAVSWAVQEKLVSGKGNRILAPKDSATRAETAAVIRRYTERIEEVEK